MTREEARQVFLSRGYVEVEGGTIYDADKWRESCRVISEWLEHEPCEDCVNREKVLGCFKFPNTKRNDFIEAIKNLPPVTPVRIETVTEFADRCRECGAEYGRRIKELEKLIENTRWIPVSERLPEEKGFYLVSVKNEHDRRYSKSCWFYGNGKWFARQEVIAWMPLPKPYNEENEK